MLDSSSRPAGDCASLAIILKQAEGAKAKVFLTFSFRNSLLNSVLRLRFLQDTFVPQGAPKANCLVQLLNLLQSNQATGPSTIIHYHQIYDLWRLRFVLMCFENYQMDLDAKLQHHKEARHLITLAVEAAAALHGEKIQTCIHTVEPTGCSSWPSWTRQRNTGDNWPPSLRQGAEASRWRSGDTLPAAEGTPATSRLHGHLCKSVSPASRESAAKTHFEMHR